MKKLLSLFAFAAIVISFAACGGKDGNNPEVSNAPEGAINGKFTVGEGKQVYFSKGNLQATTNDLGTTWTWGFAQNQWDYVGNNAANNAVSGNGKVSANGTVDLFSWSTPTTYYGIYAGMNSDNVHLGDFKDWGTAIGVGWCTLSSTQWNYLFSERNDATKLFSTGSVNGVNGVILLPDDWKGEKFTDVENYFSVQQSYGFQGNEYHRTSTGNFTTLYSLHTYTIEQWEDMEEAGAVFLPAVGERSGIVFGMTGSYWSSTPYGTQSACRMNFDGYKIKPMDFYMRNAGYSVRLVYGIN